MQKKSCVQGIEGSDEPVLLLTYSKGTLHTCGFTGDLDLYFSHTCLIWRHLLFSFVLLGSAHTGVKSLSLVWLIGDIFLILFSRKQDLTFHANCLHLRQFAWNAKSCFLGKIKKIFQYVISWKFYPECLALIEVGRYLMLCCLCFPCVEFVQKLIKRAPSVFIRPLN